MPATFDARIQRYQKMLDNIIALKALETGSTFHDIDLDQSENLFREHLAALELGKEIVVEKGTLDVDAELTEARRRVTQLETLRHLQTKEEKG
jgi:hypothetical protein